MKPKTARQTQILEFIKRFISKNGYSPSLRAIGKEIDLSPSVILTHLENMEDNGLIERMPNKARSIRIVEQFTLRPEVQWFAEQMELTLRANDHKGGWSRMSLYSLYKRLEEESTELEDTIVSTDKRIKLSDERARRIITEATDVANFAMMIADNAKGEK